MQPGSEPVKGILGCSLENGLNPSRLNLFWPETNMDQSVGLAAPLGDPQEESEEIQERRA